MPEPSAPARRWTTRELLQWMTGYFRDKGVDAPRVCSELLLAHVLGCERMRLYMEVDRPAAPEELARLRELVARGGRHEPVQHLVGHAWFFTHRFAVDRSTLIPRPSTETLVEHLLQSLRQDATEDLPAAVAGVESNTTGEPCIASGTPPVPLRIADIGTGTGCIAVALAKALPHATIVATDLVPDALELARRNAEDHGVSERIEFRMGDLWSGLTNAHQTAGFDAIASNPPYVSDREWAEVAPNVRLFEPESALRGGVDGLDLIRWLVADAHHWLRPGGHLAIEIAASQGEAALSLAAQNAGLAASRILQDHEGLDRVLVARRSG